MVLKHTRYCTTTKRKWTTCRTNQVEAPKGFYAFVGAYRFGIPHPIWDVDSTARCIDSLKFKEAGGLYTVIRLSTSEAEETFHKSPDLHRKLFGHHTHHIKEHVLTTLCCSNFTLDQQMLVEFSFPRLAKPYGDCIFQNSLKRDMCSGNNICIRTLVPAIVNRHNIMFTQQRDPVPALVKRL